MCFIELVDYNETYVTDLPKKKVKSTRRSASNKKSSVTMPVVEEAEVVEETPSEEKVLEKTKTDQGVSESTKLPADKITADEKTETNHETSEFKVEDAKQEKNAEDNETKSE